MEGPSLHLAAAQLRPFIGKRVGRVSGNTTITKERLEGEIVRDVFAWGKHLVIQCGDFALRVHRSLGARSDVIGPPLYNAKAADAILRCFGFYGCLFRPSSSRPSKAVTDSTLTRPRS